MADISDISEKFFAQFGWRVEAGPGASVERDPERFDVGDQLLTANNIGIYHPAPTLKGNDTPRDTFTSVVQHVYPMLQEALKTRVVGRTFVTEIGAQQYRFAWRANGPHALVLDAVDATRDCSLTKKRCVELEVFSRGEQHYAWVIDRNLDNEGLRNDRFEIDSHHTCVVNGRPEPMTTLAIHDRTVIIESEVCPLSTQFQLWARQPNLWLLRLDQHPVTSITMHWGNGGGIGITAYPDIWVATESDRYLVVETTDAQGNPSYGFRRLQRPLSLPDHHIPITAAIGADLATLMLKARKIIRATTIEEKISLANDLLDFATHHAFH